MKKLFIILGALAAVVGCQQAEELTQPEEMEQPSGSDYVAQIEAFKNKTKTTLEEGNSIVWSPGDQIAIFQGADAADRYQIKNESVGSSNGSFELVSNSTEAPSRTLDANIAVYPYESDLKCTSNETEGGKASYTISGITIPSTQR